MTTTHEPITFSAIDHNGDTTNFETLIANHEYLLLYFYPKDNTPGCTVEAEAMRDMMKELNENGLAVVGVSVDSPKSHQQFRDKFNLNFTLLSDESKELVEYFDVKSPSGLAKRESFLINDEGKIVKKYTQVSPANHAAEVLADVSNLAK